MRRVSGFELVNNHTFRAKEKVLVIDENGFDLWEGFIFSTRPDAYLINYPDDPRRDGPLPSQAHLLVNTPWNRAIFNAQQTARAKQGSVEVSVVTGDSSEGDSLEGIEGKPKKKQRSKISTVKPGD
jgi:hypothetical protein